MIVGPTGSGKTGVAIEIAKECEARFGQKVEIISADSRAIFRGMDIGTAKPSKKEMAGVPHHGIDVVLPDERFTIKDFQNLAREKIREVQNRGSIPMIVGGTGLYVDAVIFDYKFTQDAKKMCSDRKNLNTNFIVFGIKWESDQLRVRLEKRLSNIFTQELMTETKRLTAQYSKDLPAMKSNVYQFAWRYLEGELDFEEAKRLAVLDDYHLAKRQMTWFKRNPEIKWYKLAEIKRAVLKCIEDEQKK